MTGGVVLELAIAAGCGWLVVDFWRHGSGALGLLFGLLALERLLALAGEGTRGVALAGMAVTSAGVALGLALERCAPAVREYVVRHW